MTDEKPLLPLIPPQDVQVAHDAPVLKGVEAIDRTSARIALIADDNGKIIGSLTDGDVRRGLLKGCTLESPISQIMHDTPVLLSANKTRQEIISAMLSEQVKQLPLINDDGTLKGIAVYDMLTGFEHVPRSNPVVIMAGGKGQRLLPITQDIPKPMIELSGKPMLEHILEQFIRQGFSNFHFAVNYLSHVIEDYFGDGSEWDCQITYIHEPEFLGTAGALSLLEKPFEEPFVLINGDILTSVDFSDLLDYHVSSLSAATVCARQHRTEVPYGVIRLKDGMLETIAEKPVHEDLISAGIYALSPEVLPLIPKDTPTDMPSLLVSLVKEKKKVAVFPMREDWIDVGRHVDLQNVRNKQS